MIKVIGHTSLISSDLYEESTVEECLEYFKQHKSIAVDTETQGKDPHSDKILCLQIGDAVNQWVIDCRKVSILLFKELLESKLCIIHNVSFDYKFLKKAGIVLIKVWDTCITEAILYRGYQKVGYSLSAVCDRYCGVNLDKTTRGEFHTITNEPFTDTQIEYASLDVKYLHEIAKEQWRKATTQNILNSVLEDNRALLAYADMEYYGNKIDVVKWSKNTLKNKERLMELKSELDSFVLKEPNLCNFLKFTPPDLFNTNITLKPNINWSSPVQVKNAFNALGINGGRLESISEKVLKYHTKDHLIVPIYLEYVQTAKLISTYGDNFIDRCINKTTNRVHTSYWIVLNTGRASSGGGDENPQFPNLNFAGFPYRNIWANRD